MVGQGQGYLTDRRPGLASATQSEQLLHICRYPSYIGMADNVFGLGSESSIVDFAVIISSEIIIE